MKRGLKIAIVILFILLILLVITYIIISFYPEFNIFASPGVFTSNAVMQEGITIMSPLNITYNYNLDEKYTIDLNVSAEFTVDSWWYTLWDVKHNEIVKDKVSFNPNIPIEIVRGSNLLTVSAVSSRDESINHANVSFYVNVPNHAPLIEGIDDSIYVCEGEDSFLTQLFTVRDIEENPIFLEIAPGSGPFYVRFVENIDLITSQYELYSQELNDKEYFVLGDGWKIFETEIVATDGEYAHFANTNITVIETNNPPKIQPIGVHTVLVNGEFYEEVQAIDIEDGGKDSGDLSFSINFDGTEKLFEIDKDGIMTFSPGQSHVGAYEVSVCVSDSGLKSPHPDLSEVCGKNAEPLITCEDFSLVITDQNKPPTIIDHGPSKQNLKIIGTDSLHFNVSKYDPEGATPDTYWYVDSLLQKKDIGNLTDEFVYSFGCGVSGAGQVKAVITDGLLNDSIVWDLNINFTGCASLPAEDNETEECSEKWACNEWKVCQNAKKSFEGGVLSDEDYGLIKEGCEFVELYEGSCGVQIRACSDVNECDMPDSRPLEFQSCHYTANPSCGDGIKNCHDGGCEVLPDCGGPCLKCPTCSDGIQNQWEEGIDCGSPCIERCVLEKPLLKRRAVQYSLIIILSLIFIILFKFKKIIDYMGKLKVEMNN